MLHTLQINIVLWVNPSMYVEIVSSSSLNNPGTLSEASWLHLDRFLRTGEIDTSVVEEQVGVFGTGGISVCGRISIESMGFGKAEEILV